MLIRKLCRSLGLFGLTPPQASFTALSQRHVKSHPFNPAPLTSNLGLHSRGCGRALEEEKRTQKTCQPAPRSFPPPCWLPSSLAGFYLAIDPLLPHSPTRLLLFISQIKPRQNSPPFQVASAPLPWLLAAGSSPVDLYWGAFWPPSQEISPPSAIIIVEKNHCLFPRNEGSHISILAKRQLWPFPSRGFRGTGVRDLGGLEQNLFILF